MHEQNKGSQEEEEGNPPPTESIHWIGDDPVSNDV